MAAPRAKVPTKVATYMIMPEVEAGIGLLEVLMLSNIKLLLQICSNFTLLNKNLKKLKIYLKESKQHFVSLFCMRKLMYFPLFVPSKGGYRTELAVSPSQPRSLE